MAMKIISSHFEDLPESAEVPARTLASLLDVSEVAIWRWSKISKLPRPRKLGGNTTRFNVGEVPTAYTKLASRAETTMAMIEARRELNILISIARAFELRAMGHDIATVWTLGVTECGGKHRIARYVFRKPRYERHWLELTTRYSRLGISMCMVLSQLWRLYLYISMLWAG